MRPKLIAPKRALAAIVIKKILFQVLVLSLTLSFSAVLVGHKFIISNWFNTLWHNSDVLSVNETWAQRAGLGWNPHGHAIMYLKMRRIASFVISLRESQFRWKAKLCQSHRTAHSPFDTNAKSTCTHHATRLSRREQPPRRSTYDRQPTTTQLQPNGNL